MLLGVGSFRFRCSSALAAVALLCACERSELRVEILQPTCSDGEYTEEVYLGGYAWRFPCGSVRGVRHTDASSSIRIELNLTDKIQVKWMSQLAPDERASSLNLRSNIRYRNRNKPQYPAYSYPFPSFNFFKGDGIGWYTHKYRATSISLGREYVLSEGKNSLHGVIKIPVSDRNFIFICRLGEFENDVIGMGAIMNRSMHQSLNRCRLMFALNDNIHVNVFRLPYRFINHFDEIAKDIYDLINQSIVGEIDIPSKRI